MVDSLVLELIHVSRYDLSVQQTVHDINPNGRNSLSRNLPVALVVGAAGFIGSHVTEKLLSLNIQVVGIDDFSSGKKEYLVDFINHKYFFFLPQSVENISSVLPVESLPRLDYVFYLPDPLVSQGVSQSLLPLLDFIAKTESRLLRTQENPDHERVKKISPCKIVFTSSVFLYDNHLVDEVSRIKEVERVLASFSKDNKLNARIVRLAEIYGPRMHFRDEDPLGRLIKASVEKKLSDESTVLDFSSRALFVADAVNLLIKSVLSGFTSSKIYDGARLYPVSVAEAKELLLSNLDEGVQSVKLTKLEAWPTPNLVKTMRELSWAPRTDFIKSLRLTLDYFKENPGEEKENTNKSPLPIHGWSFKQYEPVASEIEQTTEAPGLQEELVEEERGSSWTWPFVVLISLLIITAGIIYPLAVTVGAFYFIPKNTQAAKNDLLRGDYSQANQEMEKASLWSQLSGQVLQPFLLFAKLLDAPFESKLQNVQMVNDEVGGLQQVGALMGNLDSCMQGLFNGEGTVGQNCDLNPEIYSSFYNLMQNGQNQDFLGIFNQARGAGLLLSQLNTNRNFIILWQDNFQQKANGGQVKDVVLLNFQNGKFDHMDVQTGVKLLPILSNLLGAGSLDPKVIEDKLDRTADFQTFARLTGASFTQFLGQPVDGVVSVDTTALINLVNQFGPVKDDDGSDMTGDDLFAKASTIVSPSERDLFYKKAFEQIITQVTTTGVSFGKLDQLSQLTTKKHLQFFDGDPRLESFIVDQNSGGVFKTFNNDPEQSTQDFLALYQIDATGSAKTVQKNINLSTTIDSQQVKQIASVDVGTADQDRLMFLFIPLGSRINSITQNDKVIAPTSFVQFGESGYSFSVPGKSDGLLKMDYTLPSAVKFSGNDSVYNFYLQKQAGEGSGHFIQDLQLNDNLVFADGSNVKKIDQDFDSDFLEQLSLKK